MPLIYGQQSAMEHTVYKELARGSQLKMKPKAVTCLPLARLSTPGVSQAETD